MIRVPAAIECARQLLIPVFPTMPDELIATAANLIIKAVEADELRQEIEKLEKDLAEKSLG